MNNSNDLEIKCCGPLLKKISCTGITLRIKSLDVNTANRINERALFSLKQNQVESQNLVKFSDEIYSD